jgi:hypothetical protein
VLSVLPVKTTQNANYAPLVSSPPWLRRFPPPNRNAPGYAPGVLQGVSLCYQVLIQFAFSQGKPALVSKHIKKQNAKPFLILSCLSFGQGSSTAAFFKQEKKRRSMFYIYIRSIKAAVFPIRPYPAVSFYYFRRFYNELL